MSKVYLVAAVLLVLAVCGAGKESNVGAPAAEVGDDSAHAKLHNLPKPISNLHHGEAEIAGNGGMTDAGKLDEAANLAEGPGNAATGTKAGKPATYKANVAGNGGMTDTGKLGEAANLARVPGKGATGVEDSKTPTHETKVAGNGGMTDTGNVGEGLKPGPGKGAMGVEDEKTATHEVAENGGTTDTGKLGEAANLGEGPKPGPGEGAMGVEDGKTATHEVAVNGGTTDTGNLGEATNLAGVPGKGAKSAKAGKTATKDSSSELAASAASAMMDTERITMKGGGRVVALASAACLVVVAFVVGSIYNEYKTARLQRLERTPLMEQGRVDEATEEPLPLIVQPAPVQSAEYTQPARVATWQI